ncbi:Gfo/Idh/MocA family oxidoreductase [Ulvibacterium sp.]|uniref:Gfo/Idh/MocA family protein n=1 Tax=Ulvibacterium sp. TaxID=2665914 RepID=UPI0026158F3F|nr:Gfo/Idh/MocA family oxidoreductase [Ulvibacterium sp.]
MRSSFLKFLGLLVLVSICSSVEAHDKNMQLNKMEKIQKPLRVGVVGLVHTHVHWILGREKLGDIEIVGIVEPNRELAQQYADQHGYSMNIVFASLDEMVKAVKPEAVTAFNSIYDHLETVKYCAPLGIHVMVEKPLAVSWEHAQEMIALAKKHKIHLLTNYETSWYGSNRKAYELINSENKIGNIRRMVFHTGHFGPIEIGCNPEFLEWLTDPVLNGGGALTDFGCYGANLATWFMQGQAPESVTCITQQLKPHFYPKVDDDATIILDYPENQVIIQASWNWPHHVKDMEIYGTTGYVICKNANAMKIMTGRKQESTSLEADPLPKGFHDPFALLQKVVQEQHQLPEYDVSSLENNKIVMQILEAAKHSAETHKTIIWKDMFPKTASGK